MLFFVYKTLLLLKIICFYFSILFVCLFCHIILSCKIILGEVYDYVIPVSFDARTYSFLFSVKRREIKEIQLSTNLRVCESLSL